MIRRQQTSIRSLRLQEKGVTPPTDWNVLEQVRAAKRAEMSKDCETTIYAGITVNHKQYSLCPHDQTEIIAQLSLVKDGAAAVPYHADGELCRMYPAAEFTEVANAATNHIFFHRTYINHMFAWIRDASLDELLGMTYGAELPEELAASMRVILGIGGDE